MREKMARAKAVAVSRRAFLIGAASAASMPEVTTSPAPASRAEKEVLELEFELSKYPMAPNPPPRPPALVTRFVPDASFSEEEVRLIRCHEAVREELACWRRDWYLRDLELKRSASRKGYDFWHARLMKPAFELPALRLPFDEPDSTR